MADGSNRNFSFYSIGGPPILLSFQDWYLSLVLYLRWSCSLVSSFGWLNKPAKQGNEIKTKNLGHKNVDPQFSCLPFHGLLVFKVNWIKLITSKLSELKLKFSKRDWKCFFHFFLLLWRSEVDCKTNMSNHLRNTGRQSSKWLLHRANLPPLCRWVFHRCDYCGSFFPLKNSKFHLLFLIDSLLGPFFIVRQSAESLRLQM